MAMDVRSQACAYLRHGKVQVCSAGPSGPEPPLFVRAYVDGRSHRYFVRRAYDGSWLCSCEAGGDGCPHIAAVRLVTGHGGLARKPGERR